MYVHYSHQLMGVHKAFGKLLTPIRKKSLMSVFRTYRRHVYCFLAPRLALIGMDWENE